MRRWLTWNDLVHLSHDGRLLLHLPVLLHHMTSGLWAQAVPPFTLFDRWQAEALASQQWEPSAGAPVDPAALALPVIDATDRGGLLAWSNPAGNYYLDTRRRVRDTGGKQLHSVLGPRVLATEAGEDGSLHWLDLSTGTVEPAEEQPGWPLALSRDERAYGFYDREAGRTTVYHPAFGWRFREGELRWVGDDGAFLVEREGQARLVRADGSEVPLGFDAGQAKSSGSWLYVPGKAGLHRVDLRTGQAEKIAPTSTRVYVDPAGERIAWLQSDGLWLAPAAAD